MTPEETSAREIIVQAALKWYTAKYPMWRRFTPDEDQRIAEGTEQALSELEAGVKALKRAQREASLPYISPESRAEILRLLGNPSDVIRFLPISEDEVSVHTGVILGPLNGSGKIYTVKRNGEGWQVSPDVGYWMS